MFQVPRKFFLCTLLPIVLFFLFSLQESEAHRSFGVFYAETEHGLLTQSEIETLRQYGINWIMAEGVLPESTLSLLAEKDFSVYLLHPEYFLLPHHFEGKSGQLLKQSPLLSKTDPHSIVKGVGLFAFGMWQNEPLRRITEPVSGEDIYLFTLDSRPLTIDPPGPLDGTLLFTRSARQLENQLKAQPALCGFLYSPKEKAFNLRDFQEIMALLHPQRDLPLFFYRAWFFSFFEKDTPATEYSLPEVTAFFKGSADARLANPPPSRTPSYTINPTLYLLFLFWIAYGLYYRLKPLYRRSVLRYFLNYDFFVDDVLLRRIRFTTNAVVIFLFICVMAGITGFAMADIVFDPLSLKALTVNLPLLPANHTHPFLFFLLFFLGTALIFSVMIIWLYIANRHHAKMYQIATFILWPQHLNILFVTVGIILLQSYSSPFVLLTLMILSLLITLSSFFFAAYNMRRIVPTSPLYMASTYALFMICTVILFSWLILGWNLPEIWKLAASLTYL